MPLENPDATSTPTTVPLLKGRKGIKEHNSVQSPIDLEQSRHQYETRSYTKTIDSTYESSIRKSPEQSPKRSPRGFSDQANRSGSNSNGSGTDDENQYFVDGQIERERQQEQESGSLASKWLVILGVLAVVIPLGALYFAGESSANDSIHEKFANLEKHFNKQQTDFWRNIKVSIQEIPVLDQPRTIMFLFNNKAENTLNKILNVVSSNALCSLTDCSNKAVTIEGSSLNTSEIVNDYGKIISTYRRKLEKNGVMIVKNLEKVPGRSAQAFHSFCDDYNPVVKNALILFTMKVPNVPEGYPARFVEEFLLKLWTDIGKDDKFYPLLTRITGTILVVKPE